MPARRPDHARRLTMSLSMWGRILGCAADGRLEARADRLDDERLGLLLLVGPAGEDVGDTTGQHLFDGAVERHGRELRGDRRAELAALLRALGDLRDEVVGLA